MKNTNRVYKDLIINPVVRLKNSGDNIIEKNARFTGFYIGADDIKDNIYNFNEDGTIALSDKFKNVVSDTFESMQYDDTMWDNFYKDLDYHTENAIYSEMIMYELILDLTPSDDSRIWAIIKMYINENGGFMYDNMEACRKFLRNLEDYIDIKLIDTLPKEEYFNKIDLLHEFNKVKDKFDLSYIDKIDARNRCLDGIRHILNVHLYKDEAMEYILNTYSKLLKDVKEPSFTDAIIATRDYESEVDKFMIGEQYE